MNETELLKMDEKTEEEFLSMLKNGELTGIRDANYSMFSFGECNVFIARNNDNEERFYLWRGSGERARMYQYAPTDVDPSSVELSADDDEGNPNGDYECPNKVIVNEKVWELQGQVDMGKYKEIYLYDVYDALWILQNEFNEIEKDVDVCELTDSNHILSKYFAVGENSKRPEMKLGKKSLYDSGIVRQDGGSYHISNLYAFKESIRALEMGITMKQYEAIRQSGLAVEANIDKLESQYAGGRGSYKKGKRGKKPINLQGISLECANRLKEYE